jgi:hypothetical protein
MIYRLYSSDTNTLLRMPETGMGYQIIEASKVSDYIKKKYVVYNSEIAIDLDSNFLNNKIKLFSNRVIKHEVNKFEVISKFSALPLKTESIKVLTKAQAQAPMSKMFSASDKSKKKRHLGATGAKDNRVELASGNYTFIII